jgi:acyl-CoA thioesterase FadM
MLHGGLLSAILDECLAWACAVERKAFCVTGELHVRFKSPARLGETLQVEGWAVSSWGAYVRAEGEVLAPEGGLVASATANFKALSRGKSAALQAALRLRPGDIDVLADDPDTRPRSAPLPPGPGKL